MWYLKVGTHLKCSIQNIFKWNAVGIIYLIFDNIVRKVRQYFPLDVMDETQTLVCTGLLLCAKYRAVVIIPTQDTQTFL